MDNKSNHGLVDRSQMLQPVKSDDALPGQMSPHLRIPTMSPIPRRPSPRVEDMLRSPRKAQRTRQRLTDHQTFDDAVRLLEDSQNIVVLTGAGISTSVGIPDFRSDKGLYNKLSKIGIAQPEDFFSMSYFQENPEDFFKYVREVVPTAVPSQDGTYKPVKRYAQEKTSKSDIVEVPKFTPTHAFLALLQAKNKLLTNYTQNIDGLETAAGLPSSQFIQCHGSWDSATCLTCGKPSAARKYLPVVHAGNVPYCKCFNDAPEPPKKRRLTRDKVTNGKKRKRTHSFSDHSSDDGTKPSEPPRGLLKPDIVFFEEKITPLYHSRLESDRPKIDLLIIIGTSLKVAPIQNMLFKIRPDVPQIYISKERFSGALCSLPGVQVDIELLGECDLIIEELCRRAGWQNALERLYWREGQTKIRRIAGQIKPAQTTSSIKQQTFNQSNPDKCIETQMGETPKQSKHIPENSSAIAIKMKTEDTSENTECTNITAIEFKKSAMQTSNISTQMMQFTEERKLELPAGSASKVKVELVEGTDHQWRITRKR